MKIQIERIDKNIPMPAYNVTEINGRKVRAAGLDIFARESVAIPSMHKLYEIRRELGDAMPEPETIIPMNIKIIYPENSMAFLMPRSSLCIKKHLMFGNSIGLIDESFRSEHGIIAVNYGFNTVHIEKGEKLAQLVFLNTVATDIIEVENISETAHTGFGSSDKKERSCQ